MKLTLDEALTVWCTHRSAPRAKREAAYKTLFSYLNAEAEACLRRYRKDDAEAEAVAHDVLIRILSAKPRTDGQAYDGAAGDPLLRDRQVRRYLKTAAANKVTDLWRAARGLGDAVDVDDAASEGLIYQGQVNGPGEDNLAAVAKDAERTFDAWLEAHFTARNASRAGVGENARRALKLLAAHKLDDLDPVPSVNALRVAARHREYLSEQVWEVCAAAAAHADYSRKRYDGSPSRGKPAMSEDSLSPRLRRLDACLDASRRGEIGPDDTSIECARADLWRLIIAHRYCIYEVSEREPSEAGHGPRTTVKRN